MHDAVSCCRGALSPRQALPNGALPLFEDEVSHGGFEIPMDYRERGQVERGVRNHQHKNPAFDREAPARQSAMAGDASAVATINYDIPDIRCLLAVRG